MRGRANSFAPMIPGTWFGLLATIAVTLCGSARADSQCIEQPPQPAADGSYSVPYQYAMCRLCHPAMTEVLQWTVRYDQAQGRKCWVLLDPYGRDVTAAHGRAKAALVPTSTPAMKPTFTSQLVALWSSLTGASTNVVPADIGTPPVSPSIQAKRSQNDTESTNKNDNGIRSGQRNAAERSAAKSVAQIPTDEYVLFQEFLRWRRSRQSQETSTPDTASSATEVRR